MANFPNLHRKTYLPPYTKIAIFFKFHSSKMTEFFHTFIVFIALFSPDLSKNYPKFFRFEYYTHFRHILPQVRLLIFVIYGQICRIFSTLFPVNDGLRYFLSTVSVEISVKIIINFSDLSIIRVFAIFFLNLNC